MHCDPTLLNHRFTLIGSKTKLKLDDRGRRRQGRLFPEGWEKKVNHNVMTDLIKRSPRQNGEGGRTPKLKTLYRSRAPAGWDEKMDGDCKAKLAAGTVGFEAGVSLFTDPISDVVKCI
ncbi:hypothetical protein TNCV_4642151 [Trichonephila clavipes]|nr:hypothetical protein TNCV_4642151 [Trichonephila clavipes]